MPKDLIRPGIPFGILKQASEPTLGKTIYGEEIPHLIEKKEDEKKAVTLTINQNFTVKKNGEIKCDKAGQALILPDGKIDFSEVYTVNDVRPDQMHKIDFPCSVLVKCDLQGNIDWKVQKDLTVEGFWSAQGISVQGNVVAKSGKRGS